MKWPQSPTTAGAIAGIVALASRATDSIAPTEFPKVRSEPEHRWRFRHCSARLMRASGGEGPICLITLTNGRIFGRSIPRDLEGYWHKASHPQTPNGARW